MKKNKFLLSILLFFLCLCFQSLRAQTTKIRKSQPNILVILCDDLGYGDVGFNGSVDINTPSLDKLAKNGTILNAAYVTHPFCVLAVHLL